MAMSSEKQLLILFRANMVRIREDCGLSQSELGRRIGRSAAYVCDMERGRRSPNLTSVALIAKGLGVHPDTLLYDPAEKAPGKKAKKSAKRS